MDYGYSDPQYFYIYENWNQNVNNLLYMAMVHWNNLNIIWKLKFIFYYENISIR